MAHVRWEKGDLFGATNQMNELIYGVVIEEGKTALMIAGDGRVGFTRSRGPIPENALPVVGVDTRIPYEIRFALDTARDVLV